MVTKKSKLYFWVQKFKLFKDHHHQNLGKNGPKIKISSGLFGNLCTRCEGAEYKSQSGI